VSRHARKRPPPPTADDLAQLIELNDREKNTARAQARIRAHAVFDPIWKSGAMSRPEAYLWLTRAMGEKRQVHIGEMTEEECGRVITLCLNRKFQGRR
jgi:hypothetical protein